MVANSGVKKHLPMLFVSIGIIWTKKPGEMAGNLRNILITFAHQEVLRPQISLFG